MATENTAPPEMSLPEVPQAPTLAAQMEQAANDLAKPSPRGMRKIKEKAAEPTKEPEPVIEAKPEPVAKEPVTQEKLSSGFAKLERQRKAVAREEARIKDELAKFESARAEHEKAVTGRTSEIDKRQAEIEAVASLLDGGDIDKFVTELARRRNLNKDEIYDRWTRQRLNGGVPAPEDQIAKTNTETEKLRKELEDLRNERKAEKDAADKAQDEAKKRAEFERVAAQENYGFIQHVRQPGKYPLLSAEKDEDIVRVARQAAGANKVTYDEVASYLEKMLSFQKWQEEQTSSETPKKSAPEPKGQKAEPKKANTTTNQMAATRTTQRAESTHRPPDHIRLENIVGSHWK